MRGYFKWALFFSLLIHLSALVAISLPKSSASRAKDKKIQEIEVLTRQPEPERSKMLKNTLPPPYEKDFLQRGLVGERKKGFIAKADLFRDQSGETVFAGLPKEDELMKIPDYMDYYIAIRNRIKHYVYQNRTGLFLNGDVRFHFVVSRDGELLKISFDPVPGPKGNEKEVVLKSLRQAAPFASFPEGLKQHQSLPMSMSITFSSR